MPSQNTPSKPTSANVPAKVPAKAPAKSRAAAKAKIVVKPKAAVKAIVPAKAPVKAGAARRKSAAAAKPGASARPAAGATKAVPKLQVKPEPAAVVKEKVKKAKLVRDSFTMPESEYQVLGEVKKGCLKAGVEVKKSELLRVGVALLRKLDLATLKVLLAGLPPLKAGRPKKEK